MGKRRAARRHLRDESPSVFLGVDGGATRTRALRVDVARGDVRAACGLSTNPHAVGFETAVRNLATLVAQLEDGRESLSNRVDCAYVGIAGLRSERDCREFARAGVVERIARTVEYGDDARCAWAGALARGPGIVVLCGTGSKVYGRTSDGRTVERGGFGFLLGDEGSGAWIGLRGLQAVVHAAQERAPATALTEALLRHLQCQAVDDLLAKVYAPAMSSLRFAQLCPIIAGIARQGDAVATSIFHEAARQLADLALTTLAAFPDDEVVRISYQAGVFECGELLLRPFSQLLLEGSNRVIVEQPQFSTVEGSVLLAMRTGGLKEPAKLLSDVLSRRSWGRTA